MNGIHEVGGSIPPGSTIHNLFLFPFSSLVAVIGNLRGRVSTPCSLFDLTHPLDCHLFPVRGDRVARDFFQSGMAADRHDLVRGEPCLGGDS